MTTQVKKNTRNIKLLLHPSIRQDIFHPNRLLYALTGAVLFVLLGFYIPKLWVTYAPANYYTVIQPVKVDKEVYKSCDQIVFTAVRTATIDSLGHSLIQVYLVQTNGAITKYPPIYDGSITIAKSQDKVFYLVHKLPCSLQNGDYYAQAIITYNVEGIQKTYTWVTNVFKVDNTATTTE